MAERERLAQVVHKPLADLRCMAAVAVAVVQIQQSLAAHQCTAEAVALGMAAARQALAGHRCAAALVEHQTLQERLRVVVVVQAELRGRERAVNAACGF